MIPQRAGPGGFTPNFALPTLQATVVDASDSQKKRDCQILWKRELAESGLACSSQKAQSCTIWRMLRYPVLQLSPTSLPQITLAGQVKQRNNKGSQWTNLESQLQKQVPGDSLIFDEIQQNEREAMPSTNGRTYMKTTETME